MVPERRFAGNGERQISSLKENAADAGYDLIELKYNKPGETVQQIDGFDVPIVLFNGTMIDVKFVRGNTDFYPDRRGIRYGYVVDTDANRLRIAQSLSRGWFSVSDVRLANEIEELAVKNGIDTVLKAKPEVHLRVTSREKKYMTEAEQLRAELVALKQQIANAEAEGKVKVERPLSSVKIDKRRREEITKDKED